ncbi:hypothetical protein DFH09DRAFT_1215062 [Mycena vulgaris]|nr:hypothetical protein DFH09DRAFT_1215062 [Mycena vulgaris]
MLVRSRISTNRQRGNGEETGEKETGDEANRREYIQIKYESARRTAPSLPLRPNPLQLEPRLPTLFTTPSSLAVGLRARICLRPRHLDRQSVSPTLCFSTASTTAPNSASNQPPPNASSRGAAGSAASNWAGVRMEIGRRSGNGRRGMGAVFGVFGVMCVVVRAIHAIHAAHPREGLRVRLVGLVVVVVFEGVERLGGGVRCRIGVVVVGGVDVVQGDVVYGGGVGVLVVPHHQVVHVAVLVFMISPRGETVTHAGVRPLEFVHIAAVLGVLVACAFVVHIFVVAPRDDNRRVIRPFALAVFRPRCSCTRGDTGTLRTDGSEAVRVVGDGICGIRVVRPLAILSPPSAQALRVGGAVWMRVIRWAGR